VLCTAKTRSDRAATAAAELAASKARVQQMADSAKAGTAHLPLYRCSLSSHHSVSTIHALIDSDQKAQLVQEENKGKQMQTAAKRSTTSSFFFPLSLICCVVHATSCCVFSMMQQRHNLSHQSENPNRNRKLNRKQLQKRITEKKVIFVIIPSVTRYFSSLLTL